MSVGLKLQGSSFPVIKFHTLKIVRALTSQHLPAPPVLYPSSSSSLSCNKVCSRPARAFALCSHCLESTSGCISFTDFHLLCAPQLQCHRPEEATFFTSHYPELDSFLSSNLPQVELLHSLRCSEYRWASLPDTKLWEHLGPVCLDFA